MSVHTESSAQPRNTEPPLDLNPNAEVFRVRDSTLVHQGRLTADLDSDWGHILRVQAGGIGDLCESATNSWEAGINPQLENSVPDLNINQAEPTLPFQLEDDLTDVLGLAPKQVHKVNQLGDIAVEMPTGKFIDKALPAPSHRLIVNEVFTADYYVALHNITAAPGIKADGTLYPGMTPNHIAARVKMPHFKLKIN